MKWLILLRIALLMAGMLAANAGRAAECTRSTSPDAAFTATALGKGSNALMMDTVCWFSWPRGGGPSMGQPANQPREMRYQFSDGTELKFTVVMNVPWMGVNKGWPGRAVFNDLAYSGIAGTPILIQDRVTLDGWTVNIINITYTTGAGAVSNDFKLFVADGESTDSWETWAVNTDATGGWQQVEKIDSNQSGNDYHPAPAPFTSTGQTFQVDAGKWYGASGIYILSTQSPGKMSFTAGLKWNFDHNAHQPSFQGLAIGIQLPVVRVQKAVSARASNADQFEYWAEANGTKVASAITALTSINPQSTCGPGTCPLASAPVKQGTTLLIGEEMRPGSASKLGAYNQTTECRDSSGQLVGSATLPNFTVPGYGVYTCVITNALANVDLLVTKDDRKTSVQVADTTTYTVKYMNSGISDASGATIGETPASNLTDCKVTSCSVSPAGGAAPCVAPNTAIPQSGFSQVMSDFAPGSSMTLGVSCKVAQPQTP